MSRSAKSIRERHPTWSGILLGEVHGVFLRTGEFSMTTRNLERIFHPRHVAVIGASDNPTSVGRTVLENLQQAGFAGPIYPVNPKYKKLGELPVVARVADLPATPDLALICTPAETVPDLVRQCGERGISGLIVISAGFRETGAAGAVLQEAVEVQARRFAEMRILGPNCLGVLSPRSRLNASFALGFPSEGSAAFISQSGALCTAVLDWAKREGVGFSHFVSVGNMLDIGIGDLIDYFSQDEWTESIILYVESISEAREFLSAARAFARRKPIIAYKAGRFVESAQAAASHTGAMAGVDAVYEAAFARAGIVRVFELDDMFDCAELLSRRRKPAGPRLAIVTNAGGPGVMATDALMARQGEVARLAETTLRQLDLVLPPAWSHGNPVDILGDAPPDRFAQATRLVLADEGVHAVIVILTPQAMTDALASARALSEVCKSSSKPVLAAWMGGDAVAPGIQLLNKAGIPTYGSPEQAVKAFMHLVSYTRNREVLYETPRDMPLEFQLDRAKLRAVFDAILSEGHETLSESTSKALLEAYEIPVNKTLVAWSAEDAVQLAERLGYPVVMKVLSPQITHKSDVGGVALNLPHETAVRNAFQQIVNSVKSLLPEVRIDGVTVQRMIVNPLSYEFIVGAKRDPVFGPVLMIGAGGFTAELYQDRVLELPPLSERLARRMIQSLRSWPLLRGYRGRPAVNTDRLIEVLMRLSYLVADYPEIRELDVNPLLVSSDEVIALDSRIMLDRHTILQPARPFSHLAICPYPEEFVRSAQLKDGTLILLRPIKPEDEPMWHELLARCSPESLWFRFSYVLKQTTHEMASRFCYIDYDREMAIVAEIVAEGKRQLAGVGRLVADADHQEAEFAILVGDPWQGCGLGSLLTDFCLEICGQWGIRKVVAETAATNSRMLDVFRHRGFQLENRGTPETVMVWKQLMP